ncbi:delta(14)-sterol reductase TM7SF2 [Engraulis encrasicolus]|uniref:delta(14)-sterol reductase TM7SF2 n=1 Tax=Engraulis encrasicolus TaxID=184585 RepID=UPI002FD04C69
MNGHAHLNGVTGSTATQCHRNEEELEKDAVNRPHDKMEEEEEEAWSNARIVRVCMMMTPLVMLLYEGCRPAEARWASMPSCDWTTLLGDITKLSSDWPALPCDITMPFWDWTMLLVVCVYTVMQGALYYLPFGEVEHRGKDKDGNALKYNCNGLHAFVLSSAVLVGMWSGGVFKAQEVTANIYSLMWASYLCSLLMASLLYLHSSPHSGKVLHQRSNPRKATGPDGGVSNRTLKMCAEDLAQPFQRLFQWSIDTGSSIRAFALGQDINHRVFGINMKHFFMVRIGFMGWGMVVICYLLAELEKDGVVSLPMLLVVTFQLLYILDFLVDEASVLPTKEFTQDGIGFLMIQGEYIYIPFYSSSAPYFLLQRPGAISLPAALLICLLYGLGFIMYYISNDQKDRFRKDPSDPTIAGLKTIASPSGQDLLVSSWFGWVRHPNYLGDIMMTWAWTLPCGFSSVLPYVPALLCTNLLRERALEMEEGCEEKHGEAWREYCRKVPYQLIPHVY